MQPFQFLLKDTCSPLSTVLLCPFPVPTCFKTPIGWLTLNQANLHIKRTHQPFGQREGNTR